MYFNIFSFASLINISISKTVELRANISGHFPIGLIMPTKLSTVNGFHHMKKLLHYRILDSLTTNEDKLSVYAENDSN